MLFEHGIGHWYCTIGRICNRCTGLVAIHVCMLIALYTANAYTAEREMSANVCLVLALCQLYSVLLLPTDAHIAV